MATETEVAETALQTLLDAALAVPVGAHPAKPGTGYPHVTFALLAAVDTRGNAGHTMLTRLTYRVRAISEDRSFPTALAAQIHTALHRTRTTAAGGFVTFERTAPYTLPESADGVEFRHAGGDYLAVVTIP